MGDCVIPLVAGQLPSTSILTVGRQLARSTPRKSLTGTLILPEFVVLVLRGPFTGVSL